ncbi:sulfite exporter TauE/SafE family protein 5-like [Wolffia australiana]
MARRSFVFDKWPLLYLLSGILAVTGAFLLAVAEEGELSSATQALSPLAKILQWRTQLRKESPEEGPHLAAAAALCFIAAAVSSAGGVGGGSLFLPILNLFAGIDLKRASKFSAFMVAGNALSNVVYSVFTSGGGGHEIDYDIALLSEPCMLLGVTVGVICNVAFPEWLVTLLFTFVLSVSTFKICKAGARRWKEETEWMKGKGAGRAERVEDGRDEVAEPLLEKMEREGETTRLVQLKKMGVLVMIWLCFFLLQSLRQDTEGRGVVKIKRCGIQYWLITLFQAPVALLFTTYIVYVMNRQRKRRASEDASKMVIDNLPKIIFPVAALVAGVLGGLFGIGGGLLTNPVLLQIGVPPQTAAATSCFMVLFSSSMSAVQYLMMGMKEIRQALIMGAGCGISSLVGVVLIEKAIRKYRRASLVIFTLGTVMALSSISVTGFGLIDIWKDYVDGKSLGFKLPC